MMQQSGSIRHIVLVTGIMALVFANGCSSSKKKDLAEGGVPNAPLADENANGDSDSGKAMGLQTAHFPYDSAALTQEAKDVLSGNAMILKDKASAKIQIEGHCDIRGGIQYNIALGEKRANAARKYLADLGVSGDRMTVISFGKERLLDQGTSEAAHAKNRRANFVITSR